VLADYVLQCVAISRLGFDNKDYFRFSTIPLLFGEESLEKVCFDSFILQRLFNRRAASVEELSSPQ
jgi:hypothetical protein